MYYLKHAEPRDVKKAYQYFIKAAENTDPESDEQSVAMFYLSELYRKGIPELMMQADHKTAYEYLEKSANLGNVSAIHNKGDALLNGRGVKQDREAARLCFEASLAKGNLYSAA